MKIMPAILADMGYDLAFKRDLRVGPRKVTESAAPLPRDAADARATPLEPLPAAAVVVVVGSAYGRPVVATGRDA